MRALIVLFAIVVLAMPAFAGREIEGATVTLVAPTSMTVSTTYLFEFWVQNASSDAEWITNVHISFPDGFTLYDTTMGYDMITADRPSWDAYVPVIDHTAIWEDNNGGYGEIYSTEGTRVFIECTTPDVFYSDCIYWTIWGDEYGAEPHMVCGCIDFIITPVEEITWGSIKALYR